MGGVFGLLIRRCLTVRPFISTEVVRIFDAANFCIFKAHRYLNQSQPSKAKDELSVSEIRQRIALAKYLKMLKMGAFSVNAPIK